MRIFGFGIGSFYNELTLAILYHVVDTCDDREHCSWEQNDSNRVQDGEILLRSHRANVVTLELIGRELYFVCQLLHSWVMSHFVESKMQTSDVNYMYEQI